MIGEHVTRTGEMKTMYKILAENTEEITWKTESYMEE